MAAFLTSSRVVPDLLTGLRSSPGVRASVGLLHLAELLASVLE
jgi:hypothetical protein